MSLLLPHCHPAQPHPRHLPPPQRVDENKGTFQLSHRRGWTRTRRHSERSDHRRGPWSDLGQRLAVLRSPATQQLHHVLGALGHGSLNAQSVPQLLGQQLGTWEEGQPSGPCPALPCPSLPLKASPGSGDPLASRLLIFIRSRATFSWLSRSICWAAARSFLP